MSLVKPSPLTVLIATTVLAGLFQNCAQTKFTAAGADLNAKDLAITAPASPGTTLPAAGVPVPEVPSTEMPSTDVSKNCEDAAGGETADEVRSAQIACQGFPSAADVMAVPEDIVTLAHVRGLISVGQANSVSITDSRGQVFVATQDLGDLSDLRGSVCIHGRMVGGVIGKGGTISNHRGRLEISDMNIASIENSRGDLIIHGGSVKTIRNHRGMIRLIGTQVESVNDIDLAQMTLEGGAKVLQSSKP
jgi:hypothetical protein